MKLAQITRIVQSHLSASTPVEMPRSGLTGMTGFQATANDCDDVMMCCTRLQASCGKGILHGVHCCPVCLSKTSLNCMCMPKLLNERTLMASSMMPS